MKNEFTNKELGAIRHIRNFLMHNGRLPSIRELMRTLGYKSPRSVSLIIESLIEKGILVKKEGEGLMMQLSENFVQELNHAETVDVPLVGEVACGTPLLAEENIEAYIKVSIKLAKPGNKYFLLKAKGDSMNKKDIHNGDLVLIKQQNYANDKDLVVALVDDEATIKELNLKNDLIILKPHSTKRNYQPIILTSDFRIQGIVVATIKF